MLYISKHTLIHVVTYCYAMISNGDRIRVFPWYFQYIQMFIFLLFVCVDLLGPTPECGTSVSELPLLFAISFFLIEICPERSTHTTKQRIYLIYLRIWVLRLVCVCQVFCEDLNSNSVSKLFILIWSYEGVKVMNLGFVKSDGKLFITLKFEFFITLV